MTVNQKTIRSEFEITKTMRNSHKPANMIKMNS